jgi:hypothetical protein
MEADPIGHMVGGGASHTVAPPPLPALGGLDGANSLLEERSRHDGSSSDSSGDSDMLLLGFPGAAAAGDVTPSA